MGGITLVITFIALMCWIFFSQQNQNYKSGNFGFLIFLFAILLIILFYNDSLRNPAFLMIFFNLIYFGKYFPQIESNKA
jgi:hypothetical protein